MSPIREENRKRYPPDWKAISLSIRERAGWRCECAGECGHPHDGRCERVHGQRLRQRYEIDGSVVWSRVVLTVAHLDHTPENCADDNLKAMCNACHLRYDREHHAHTRSETKRRAILASGQTALAFGLGTELCGRDTGENKDA